MKYDMIKTEYSFRELLRAVSKHKYEVKEYNPNGSYQVKLVNIDDTNGRMGKEQFYEVRYQSSWHLISKSDFDYLYSVWEPKNKNFVESLQKAVVELDHENANDPTIQ